MVFNNKMRKDAQAGLEAMNKKFMANREKLIKHMETLYGVKGQLKSKGEEVQEKLNQFANTPKEYNAKIQEIKVALNDYEEIIVATKSEINKDANTAGGAAIAGALAGTATAALAPTAAMAIATTFGTASTGAAISTLGGAAATNAALAWLGGGALAAGGGGMALGDTLLALAGPIGWGIAGVSAAGAGIFMSGKNKKNAEKMQEQTIEIKKADSVNLGVLDEVSQMIRLLNRTNQGLNLMEEKIDAAGTKNYLELSKEEVLNFGLLVSLLVASTKLLNLTLGETGKFDRKTIWMTEQALNSNAGFKD